MNLIEIINLCQEHQFTLVIKPNDTPHGDTIISLQSITGHKVGKYIPNNLSSAASNTNVEEYLNYEVVKLVDKLKDNMGPNTVPIPKFPKDKLG